MSLSPEPESLSMSPSPADPFSTLPPPSKPLPSLDLLHWSDSPPHNAPHSPRISATSDSSAFIHASDERPFQPQHRPVHRSHQPAGGISTISFGASSTQAEPDRLFQRRRPGSDVKRREMTGSRIFDYEPEPKKSATPLPAEKTLDTDVARSMPSQCTISTEDLSVSTKKEPSISEVAKKRELSGSYLDAGESNSSVRRPCSSAKSKELEGSNIFGRSMHYGNFSSKSSTSNLDNVVEIEQENKAPRTSVKVSNPAGGRSQISFGSDGGQGYGNQSKRNLHDHKVAELLGNNIFENGSPLQGHNENRNTGHNERIVSAAKRREMIGNDIFSTAKALTPELSRSDRQPPGGRSSLKLL